MLHLADVFGFTDRRSDELPPVDLGNTEKIFIELKNPRLSFTSQQIADTVRGTANGIFTIFRKQLESATTLSVQQKAIAIVLPHSCSQVFAFLAVAGLSMAACPIHPNLSTNEFKYAFRDLNIAMVIVASDSENPGAERAARDMGIPIAWFSWRIPENPAETPVPIIGEKNATEPAPLTEDMVINPKEFETCLRVQTAGTTAKAKVVSLTHRNLALSLANTQKTYGWLGDCGAFRPEEYDVGYCVVPIHTIHGLIAGCLAPLSCQSVVLVGDPDFSSQEFWKHIVEYRVTWTTLVPDLLIKLVDEHESFPQGALHQLKFIRISGGPLSPSVAADAETKFKTLIAEAYALTEASHQICSNGYPVITDRLLGSVGRPTGTEIAILRSGGSEVAKVGEAGDVWVRGYTVIDQYDGDLNDKHAVEFMKHNEINWDSNGKAPPAYFSSSFDLTPGFRRKYSSLATPMSKSTPTAISPVAGSPFAHDLQPPSPAVKQQGEKMRGVLCRFASVLDAYLESEFPERTEPLVSPLHMQIAWFKTGDTGFIDSNGHLFIIGRNNDIINSGGVKISPLEIEEVYKGFPEVEDAAAFGVREHLGEVVYIALVMKEGFQLTDGLLTEYKRKARDSLAYFKVPKETHQVKALPVDIGGRLLRTSLAESFQSR